MLAGLNNVRSVAQFDELRDTVDDELFSKVVRLSDHVLRPLLPPSSTASHRYNLRSYSCRNTEHNYLTVIF